jgi:hypothetical protein
MVPTASCSVFVYVIHWLVAEDVRVNSHAYEQKIPAINDTRMCA